MRNNSGFSSSRLSISNTVRKTILHIKEITNNHTEDDIYAMLRECSMDPNETTQRLLQLGTFQEVKSKREKKKEMAKNRAGEESRLKPGYQGQGMRGDSSSQNNSADAGVRKNIFVQKTAVADRKEMAFRNPSAGKSLSSVNWQVKVPNGSIFGGPDTKLSQVGDGYSEDAIGSAADSFSAIRANASAEHAPSASYPLRLPLREVRSPAVVGAINRNVRLQQKFFEAVTNIPAKSKTESLNNLNRSGGKDLNGSKAASSMIDKEASDTANGASIVKPSSAQGVAEVASKPVKLKFSRRQHVIIPDHIQVPDAVKKKLTFGSIDASFHAREKNVKSDSAENLQPFGDSGFGEATTESSSCDNDGVTITSEAEHADHPECQSHLAYVPSHVDIKDDKPQADNYSVMGSMIPFVGTTPSISFGFVPPLLANLVQPIRFESQAHASSSLSGNVPVVYATSTPPSTESSSAGRSPIVSPQLIPFFHHVYPPNFIPYAHCYSPVYAPPTMHQHYGHTVFPAPVPTSNVFPTPPSAASGMKVSPPHSKPGANTGNQVPSGIPSGYGSYSQSQLGYSPNAVATSENASTGEDMPNGLMENNIHPGQQSDDTAVWPAAPDRDTTSFPMSTFLNFAPQGQHVIDPQSRHGAFAVYHTLQPMVTPTPILPLLQQTQPVVGPTDAVGPPPKSYQQSRRRGQSNR